MSKYTKYVQNGRIYLIDNLMAGDQGVVIRVRISTVAIHKVLDKHRISSYFIISCFFILADLSV